MDVNLEAENEKWDFTDLKQGSFLSTNKNDFWMLGSNSINYLHHYRFYVLFLSILTNFGYYFCYDVPNALSDVIFDKLTHEETESIKYNQLYSVISFPNIFLPFIGGIVISKFGVNHSIMILSISTFIGQLIFTISGFLVNNDEKDFYPFMLALSGRFIFGLGGEILNVWEITVLSKYFKNKELSFAIGAYYSITWIGAPLSNYIMPLLSVIMSLGITLSIASVVWIISLLAAIIFIYLDSYINDINTRNNWLEIQEEFHCKDIKELSYPFWLIMINCMLTFIGALYDSISNDFFSSRYGFDQIEAARFGANSNVVFILLTPIFGIIIDKMGHRITGMIISSVTLTISQILFIIIPSSTEENKSYLGYFPIMILSIGQAVYFASIFSTITLIVKPHIHGTAFGLSASFINIGMTFGFGVIGSLIYRDQKENSFFWVNISLTGIGVLALVTTMMILIHNRLYLDNILQKSNILEESESQELLNRNENQCSEVNIKY